MRAFMDQNSIVVSEGDSTILISSGDFAFRRVHDYLSSGGRDFSEVSAIVDMFKVERSLSSRLHTEGKAFPAGDAGVDADMLRMERALSSRLHTSVSDSTAVDDLSPVEQSLSSRLYSGANRGGAK